MPFGKRLMLLVLLIVLLWPTYTEILWPIISWLFRLIYALALTGGALIN